MDAFFEFAMALVGDIPGRYFIKLFIGSMIAAIVFRYIAGILFRPSGASMRISFDETQLTPVELGLIRGGVNLAINSVIASLMHRKVIKTIGLKREFALVPDNRDEVKNELEQAIILPLNFNASKNLTELQHAAKPGVKQIRDELVRRGLLMSPGMRTIHLLLVHLPMLLVLLVGSMKSWLGLSRGYPTGFLVIGILIGTVVCIISMTKYSRATRKGVALVKQQIKSHQALKTSAGHPSAILAPEEVAMTVALFGVSALNLAGFDAIRRSLVPTNSNGGGGFIGCGAGGSGGGGGGGCGGGGCGGCGS